MNPNAAWKRFWSLYSRVPLSFDSCSKIWDEVSAQLLPTFSTSKGTHIILTKRKHRHQVRSLPHRKLDEPHPPLERQVRRPRPRTETLRRSSHHDRQRRARTYRESVSVGAEEEARTRG